MRSLLQDTYAGKRIWISGDTGFKGAWLASWLIEIGADVWGFALDPPTAPALFDQLGLARRIRHRRGDLRDAAAVRDSIDSARPDYVFHLGAQAIVRAAYEQPVETFATNVLGTIHVMEALRAGRRRCSAVFITTDKCYENRDWPHGYREEDSLGGADPYSSSKAAAEIAIAAWRRSFFPSACGVRVASARAGNVIGGGDWARDRIVPDCVRALRRGSAIAVRNRLSTRPWQHVLEPLSGYLWLGAVLSRSELRPYDPGLFTAAFNFGPSVESNRTVEEVVMQVLHHWPGTWEDKTEPGAAHEAKRLHLSADKAYHLLGWKPVWDFAKAVEATAAWYRAAEEIGDGPGAAERLSRFTAEQIAVYERDAAQSGASWAAAAAAAAGAR